MKKHINSIMMDHGQLLINLRDRWQAEKEYEDINDYLVAIQKSIPSAFKIYKRPFAIAVKHNGLAAKISLKAKNGFIHFQAVLIKA